MVSPPECLQRIARLTPLDDVLVRIEERVKPVEPRHADLTAALGATLAGDIVVETPVPPMALALRDGWALASELTADAGSYAPAPIAGAVRVNVGDKLPPGIDAVAPVEAVTVHNRDIEVLAAVAPGEGVLPPGGDIARAGKLLEAGRRLGALELALLRAAGVAGLNMRLPRLRLARARAEADRIIDGTLDCIAGAIHSAGGLVSGDAHEPIERALTAAGIDAVIAVGGSGIGSNDRTIWTLASVGELIVHGIALVPAETAAFGMAEGRPVLVLPGRLDAAVAAWHMLGRAMMTRLTGAREQPPMRTAKLTHKVSSAVGLAELVPVRCESLFATPIASGYVPLSALAQANGWVFVAAASEGYPPHTEVMIRPWP